MSYYEILDEKAYNDYWIGKKPRTKKIFDDAIKNKQNHLISYNDHFGVISKTVYNHSKKLKELGIIRKVIVIEPKTESDNPLSRRILRREIKEKLMFYSLDQLKQVLTFLSQFTNKEKQT